MVLVNNYRVFSPFPFVVVVIPSVWQCWGLLLFGFVSVAKQMTLSTTTSTTCGEVLRAQHAFSHTSNACFSRFGSFWVLYCTAYGAKEHAICTTGALDSPFYTVVYLWCQAIGWSRGQTGFTAHVTVSTSKVMIQLSLHRKKTSISTYENHQLNRDV